MKNIEQWTPSKFSFVKGRLRASRDVKELAISSRINADTVARCYSSKLPRHACGALLDLGCGKVPLYFAYKDLVESITCVDWENSLHKNPHLDQHCDLTQPLPFEPSKFDTIILSDVLEHIPNPEVLCAEIARLLKPNGKVILNTPFLYWLHEQPHDYYRYTEFALTRLMSSAGLVVIELLPLGGAPEVIGDVLAKCASRLPYGGEHAARVINGAIEGLLMFRFGKRLSTATNRQFPQGYFVVAQKQVIS